MNELIFNPEIHRPNWLPSLGLATALHLLLLLALLYAPGFPHLRREVKDVVHLVKILDWKDPGKEDIAGPGKSPPQMRPAGQTAPIEPSARTEISKNSQTAVSDSQPATNEQAQTLHKASVHGLNTGPLPARQFEEKTGGAAGAGGLGANAGMAGPARVIAGGIEADEKESARKRYLAGLMAHIEAHKYYPLAARRRRLEGAVQVRFTLEAGGLISGLQASDGEPVLEQAALEAVQRALPLPAPKGAAPTPLPVSYRMNFQLQ